MNYILFDDERTIALRPLTFMRPACDLRVGALTIRRKWEKLLETRTSTCCSDHLSKKHPIQVKKKNLFLNGRVLPNFQLLDMLGSLDSGDAFVKDGLLIAVLLDEAGTAKFDSGTLNAYNRIELQIEVAIIDHTWQLFENNKAELVTDYNLLTKGRESAIISDTNHLLGSQLFVEEDVKMEFVTLNTKTGPVYIDKGAEIMEGTTIRGPVYIGPGTVVNMGSRIYGGTSVGPECRIGGELRDCIFIGYSNKAHDGFIGNSVIGEWCNLGAGTITSNLKNSYEHVRLWEYDTAGYTKTGLQFCGLIMGDHSKTGINTMLNAGTVTGIFANVFGEGFQKNFIPSFSYNGVVNQAGANLGSVMQTAATMYERRHKVLDTLEKDLIAWLFGQISSNRRL